MKKLNPKHSGQLAGFANDVLLLKKLHGALHAAYIAIHHFPSDTNTMHNQNETLLIDLLVYSKHNYDRMF